jgi:hypothetical protein
VVDSQQLDRQRLGDAAVLGAMAAGTSPATLVRALDRSPRAGSSGRRSSSSAPRVRLRGQPGLIVTAGDLGDGLVVA